MSTDKQQATIKVYQLKVLLRDVSPMIRLYWLPSSSVRPIGSSKHRVAQATLR